MVKTKKSNETDNGQFLIERENPSFLFILSQNY